MTSPINRLIDASMSWSCTKCGAKGIGTCACWERCCCGWLTEPGKPCHNANTIRCSTKLKYGGVPSCDWLVRVAGVARRCSRKPWHMAAGQKLCDQHMRMWPQRVAKDQEVKRNAQAPA